MQVGAVPLTVTVAEGMPPKLTVAPVTKPAPMIETAVPPEIGPETGEM